MDFEHRLLMINYHRWIILSPMNHKHKIPLLCYYSQQDVELTLLPRKKETRFYSCLSVFSLFYQCAWNNMFIIYYSRKISLCQKVLIIKMFFSDHLILIKFPFVFIPLPLNVLFLPSSKTIHLLRNTSLWLKGKLSI